MGRIGGWVIGMVLVGGLTLAARGGEGTPTPGSGAGGLPRLVHLEPGATVDEGPPAGWSDRVLRSRPRLASGELASLPDSARATATLLRPVLAADVVGRPGAYRLGRVGLGNAVLLGGREVVTTPDGPAEVLETLGLVERVVLGAAEAKLAEGALVARTPTFALLRSPSVLVLDGRHRDVDLNYALLVDPVAGGLTTLAWALPTGSTGAPRVVVVLPEDLSFDVALDVRVTRRAGPIPLAWSFAMAALPPGSPLAVPEAVARQIADAAQPGSDPAALEQALRSLVAPESP